MFIFDVFPLATKWVVVEGLREDEFAPVKNEPGNVADSPDTARAMLTAQAIRWLQAAGAEIITTTGATAEDTLLQCEISPLLSYAGEGLSQYANEQIVLPVYLK